MGILTALKAITISPLKALQVDERRMENLIEQTKIIQDEIKAALDDIETGRRQEASHELFLAANQDLSIIQEIKSRKDVESYLKAKKILELSQKALLELHQFQSNANIKKLLQTIDETITQLLKEELTEQEVDQAVISDFLTLYHSNYLTQMDIDNFSREYKDYFSPKPRKKIFKRIISELKKKISSDEEKDYETFLFEIVTELTRIPSTKSSPDEQRELDFVAEKIYRKFPHLTKEKIIRDLSKIIHETKRTVGRKGL